MSQPHPTDGFQWLEKHEIDQLFVKIMELGVNDEKGYILEVDLEMPKDKHDYFNHYLPAPQHVEVTEDMLSYFNIQCVMFSCWHWFKQKSLLRFGTDLVFRE